MMFLSSATLAPPTHSSSSVALITPRPMSGTAHERVTPGQSTPETGTQKALRSPPLGPGTVCSPCIRRTTEPIGAVTLRYALRSPDACVSRGGRLHGMRLSHWARLQNAMRAATTVWQWEERRHRKMKESCISSAAAGEERCTSRTSRTRTLVGSVVENLFRDMGATEAASQSAESRLASPHTSVTELPSP